MLQLTQVYYHKKAVTLLQGIEFTLGEGEILAVIGPNGAGKTTLIKTILNELQPQSGQVLFNGRDISTIAIKERARQVAVLPQLSLLNFPYSVDEVVMLGRMPHGSGLRNDTEIVRAAMRLMDIEYLSGRLYTELSGGEKQRTQLARVMAQIWRAEDGHPRLLILDEPTSALDLGHKQQLMQAILEFARQGVGVVWVEHDLNMVAQYANQLLALQCGHTVAYGAVVNVLTESLIENLFAAKIQLLRNPSTGKVVVSL